jgi:hypothetical protein
MFERAPGWLWDMYWSPSHVFELISGGRCTNRYGLCHDTNSYHDRISGVKNGAEHMGLNPNLASMWIEAGNIVQ